MTTLLPMRPAAYATWLAEAIAGYAHDNVEAGRWVESGAIERSRDDFLSLLPDGLATRDHHLFEILGSGGGATVGCVWYAIDRRYGACQAFIYDVVVLPEHRRQGHARRALRLVEQHAASQGATSMGLNVFAGNDAARALYRELGYTVTNLNMSRTLRPAGPA